MKRLAWLAVVLICALCAPPALATTIERVVSPGGIVAWLVRDKSVPVVALEFTFRGGSSLDAAGKEGALSLMADMLDEGAGDMNSQRFKGALEDRSISLGFSAGLDTVRGSLKTLSKNLDLAADYLRLSLTQPRFDADALGRVKTSVIQGLRRSAEEPRTIASQTWMATGFPGHPYSRPSRGTPDSVAPLTADDLRAALGARLARDNLVIGAAGDIEPARLAALLDHVFGALPARAAPGVVAEAMPVGLGQTIVVRRAVPQSVVTFGEAGLKRNDPDYYAAFVLNYVLGGGGFNSRLNEEVREKRGLAYSIFSGLSTFDRTGLLLGSTATENSRVAQSIEIIAKEWGRLRDGGPTETELRDAKIYLTGSFPLSLTSTAAIAGLMSSIQYDSLGIDYLDRRDALINGVTLDDVRRVGRRLLDPARLLNVVVGEPTGLGG